RYRRPLSDVLEENAVELLEHESEATLGRSSNRHADHIEQEFIPVTGEPEPTVTTDPPAGLAPRLQAVTDEFLQSAGELDNYRVGVLPGDVGIALVCRTQTSRDWCLVGKYPDHATAEEAARRLACTMQSLRRHCRQLYFVEHTLLRFGRRVSTADQEQTDPPFSRAVKPQPPFQYSFTLTAVVSRRAGASRTEDDRRMVREIIRENTPAHIVAEVCFLGYAHMRRFEALYWAWRSALRHQAPWEMARTSARLRRFLETHCHCRNTSP
ncbi:MAG: hypothetical protein K1Y36_29820, partial [Blastocatellia bacterium]|nr:hypothetical protein [Blastocatellia bacterium]